jgi:hypothetical protein
MSQMLAVQTQNKIIPKLVKMADGRIALVHFLVSFEGGELKAKIVSVQYSRDNSVANEAPLAICGSCEKAGEIISEKKYYERIVSPYAKFAFLVSQPTRAPSVR